MKEKQVFEITAPMSTEPQRFPLDSNYDCISKIEGTVECDGVTMLLNDCAGKVFAWMHKGGDVFVQVNDPKFFGSKIFLVLTYDS